MQAAGAAGTGAGHKLPGELPFRACREGARLLMAHMDPLDLALMDGAGDAVKRVADDPVAPLHPGGLQRLDQYVGYPFAHSEPRVFIGYVSALCVQRCICRFISSADGIMLPFKLAMIQSEPAAIRITMS